MKFCSPPGGPGGARPAVALRLATTPARGVDQRGARQLEAPSPHRHPSVRLSGTLGDWRPRGPRRPPRPAPAGDRCGDSSMSRNFIGGAVARALSGDDAAERRSKYRARSYGCDRGQRRRGRRPRGQGGAAGVRRGAWGRTTAVERGRMLTRLPGLIHDHAPELAELEARDTGKPHAAGDGRRRRAGALLRVLRRRRRQVARRDHSVPERLSRRRCCASRTA